MKGLKTYTTMAIAAAFAGIAGAQGISVYVNGEPVQFTGARPQQMNGRVMVPLRGVMEKLGAYVSYLKESRTVIATKGDVDMQMRIGENYALVNGRRTSLDVPAQIYGASTMVPLRFMSEALGAQVLWDAPTMAVRIQTTDAPPQNPPVTQRPQPTQPNPLRVTSFDMDSTGFTRAGDRVTFTLEGTPGGQAIMQIPGITDSINMAEVAPGRYQAIVTVPQNAMTITKANAVARLRVGDQEQAIQGGRNFMVDTQAPVLREPFPQANSRTTVAQPNITIELEDLDGSGIDQTNVRMWVDNRDVSREAQITGSAIFYRPNQALAAGEHTVRVIARDKAGNQSEKNWKFTVGGARNVAERITHNGAKRLRPGQVVKFTVRGEAGSSVTYNIGDKIMNLPTTEVSPGVYEGSYTVRIEDDLAGTPVTARLRTRTGEVYDIDATQLLGEIGPPMKPTFTSPDPTTRSIQGGTVNFRGKAGRRAKVKVTVDYTSTLLGLFKTNGSIAERTVFADEDGNWETGDIKLDSNVTGAGTVYTVTAVAVGKNNVMSEPTKLTLQR